MTFNETTFRLLQFLLAYFPTAYVHARRIGRLWGGRNGVGARRAVAESSEGAFNVLILDHNFPDPAQDAGSKAIYHLAKLLVEEGMVVAFWSASTSSSEHGRALLSRLGVETASRRRGGDLLQWLGKVTGRKPFDAAILSRPLIASIYNRDVRKFASDRCLYYGHDIHYSRLAAMCDVDATHVGGNSARCMMRIEHLFWREMDVVFYPSDDEVAAVNSYRQLRGLPPNAVQLPLWSVPLASSAASLTERRGMLFVGSYNHPPNVDGLDWFFTEVLPNIRDQGCFETVYVVGTGMEIYRPPGDDPHVAVIGWLADENLERLYKRVRLALIPLRYGAGIKGKVLEALAHGLPCVTTSVGKQGLSAAYPALEATDEAEQFSAAVMRLFKDDVYWTIKSAAGQAYMTATHSKQLLVTRVMDALRGR